MGRVSAAAAAFLALPAIAALVLVLIAALQGGTSVDLPPQALTLASLVTVAGDPRWQSAGLDTFAIALPAALLAVLLGTLAALGLYARPPQHRGPLLALLLLPTVLPPLLVAVGWYPALQRLGLYDRPLGVALLHAGLCLPLAALPVLGGLQRLGSGIWCAAASLGIGPWRSALRLVLPALSAELGVAAVLSLLYSLNEVSVSLFLTAIETRPLVQLLWSGVRFEYSPAVFGGTLWLLCLEGVIIGLLLRSTRFLHRG